MSISNKDDLIVIDKTNKKNKVGLWCKLCQFVLITAEDFACVKDHNCCEECWMTFGQMRQEDWRVGWRPDSETLNRYKQSRRIINIDIAKILGE